MEWEKQLAGMLREGSFPLTDITVSRSVINRSDMYWRFMKG